MAEEKESAGTAVIEEAPKLAAPKPRRKVQPKQLPPYNVVLLDDDDHSYQYVIGMLEELFAHPPELGNKMAKELDTAGRVIVLTTHKEKAELKRDQILAFGKDPIMASSKGSMSAVIEPVEG